MSKRKTTMEQLAEGVGLPSMEMLVADHEEIESLRKRLAELEAELKKALHEKGWLVGESDDE